MSESAKVQKISQILLKPVALVLSDNSAELSDAYLATLLETLMPPREETGGMAGLEEDEGAAEISEAAEPDRAEPEVEEVAMPVRLEYVRSMSGGVHVLGLEPPIELAQAIRLTERLSARDDVEYAEPDQPRRR